MIKDDLLYVHNLEIKYLEKIILSIGTKASKK
jgi:hypothetical protein